jgi:undecaprenyl pyrophosphate phosphatase UppP
MGWRAGIISAVASVYTGAVFGCYMSRRTERGLWMLALLVAIGTAAFYALVLAMQIRDWLRSTAPQPWWVAVDLAVALGFVKVAIRASWTVVVQNRKIVK